MDRQNTEGCKKIVTLFSYIVWQSAMTFCTMRGISCFGELWPSFTEDKFSTADIYRILLVAAQRNLGALEIVDLQSTPTSRSGGPAIPCGDMYQSFTDALVMVALWNRADHYIFILWFLLLLLFFLA